MLIISQNAANYGIPLPEDTIYRINLAWVNSIKELEDLLEKHQKQKIFLDLPKGRIKPPNNRYSLEDLFEILNNYDNIKYFAISNVNSPDDLALYVKVLPKEIIIVPKIESPKAVLNIKNIVEAIPTTTKILMVGTIRIYTCSVPHCGRRNILPLRGRNAFLANACLDICKTQLSRLIPYRHRIAWRPDGGGDIFDVGLVLKGAILA